MSTPAGEVAPITVEEPRCYALVIGIDEYDDAKISDLYFAAEDAQAMAQRLGREDACRVTTLVGRVSRAEIQSELDTLESLLSEEDTLIVYMAMHGRKESLDGAPLLLLASDSSLAESELGAYSLDELERQVGQIPARTRVVILDACRSVWGAGEGQRGEAEAREPSPLSPGFEEAWLFATADGAASREDPTLQHGIFTNALLVGLDGSADSDGDLRVTVTEAYAFALRDLQEREVSQRPELRLNTNRPDAANVILTRLPPPPPTRVVSASVGPYFSPYAWSDALNGDIDRSLSTTTNEQDWPLRLKGGAQIWFKPHLDPGVWRYGISASIARGEWSSSGDVYANVGAEFGGPRLNLGPFLGLGSAWQIGRGHLYSSAGGELGLDLTLTTGPVLVTASAAWRMYRVEKWTTNDLDLSTERDGTQAYYQQPTLSVRLGSSKKFGKDIP